jgi:HK97 family phage major capsid protein
MKLKELYEAREGLASQAANLEKEMTALTEKAKNGDAHEVAEMEAKAAALSDKAKEVGAQLAAVREQIEKKEGALEELSQKAAERSAASKYSSKPDEYLKTAAALEDFGNVLLASKDSLASLREAWGAKLREKGVTNPQILYPTAVVSAIQDAFEAAGSIFGTFNKAYGFTVFKKVVDDNVGDTARARQHKPGTTKKEQEISLQGKEIACDYVYKYLILDKKIARETQSVGALMRYVLAELPQRVVREIEMAAIIGDGRSPTSDEHITCYKAITAEAAAYCASVTSSGNLYDDVIDMLAKVRAPGAKYLVTSKRLIAEYRKAKGADGHYLVPPGADLAALLGVKEIFTPDWFEYDDVSGATQAVVYAGESYFVIGDSTIQNYENFVLAKNQNEFLAELYTGGGLLDLNSAAKLIAPTPTPPGGAE